MIEVEVNNGIVVKQSQELERALTTHPNAEKAIRRMIRSVLLDARAEVVDGISAALKNDPREAARAVRTTVYEQILGGNINIYSSKRAHGNTSYVPPKKGSTGRGGNRRQRSAKTERYMGYHWKDRGFILRWVDSGVQDRAIQFTPNEKRKQSRWNRNPNTGNRSSFGGGNFFQGLASSALEKAKGRLADMINEEMENWCNNMK